VAGSAKEEVTFLPSALAAATVGEQISFGLLDGEEVNGETIIYRRYITIIDTIILIIHTYPTYDAYIYTSYTPYTDYTPYTH
jgi:hypothetical protein